MYRQYRLIQMGLGFLLASASFVANAQSPQQTTAPTAAQTQNDTQAALSFTLTAPAGQVTRTSTGLYRVTLQGVNPYLTYFTRRPGRQSGTALLSNFIQAWTVGGDQSFSAINPNGVFFSGLINGQSNDDNHFVVGVISSPAYNPANETFTCGFTPLPNQHFLFDNTAYQHIILTIN